MEKEWARGFAELIWWLERAGLAIAIQWQHGWPTTLRITRRGLALINGNDADNPLLPGFLNRVRERCPGLPHGAVALLVDARACLDRALFRPALVLMGVAYELAIENVIDALATKGLVKPDTIEKEAAERLRRIRAFLVDDAKLKMIVLERDDRARIRDAYDFADRLRLRRNDAAHTKPLIDFDQPETEEFIVSAGQHLAGLWMLRQLAS
jgi:hypothetical protein